MRLLRFAIAVLVTATAIVLMMIPAPPDPNRLMPEGDKVAHAVGFAVMTGLWWLAGLRPRTCAALGLALAIGTELAQWKLVRGRTGDPLDACADLVGVVLALGAIAWWIRRRAPAVEPSSAR